MKQSQAALGSVRKVLKAVTQSVITSSTTLISWSSAWIRRYGLEGAGEEFTRNELFLVAFIHALQPFRRH